METSKNPIDYLLPVIAQAIEEWKESNTPQKLAVSVKSMLDKESKQITLKLMGFDSSYGGWTLDHCNGRAGNSLAGDYLYKFQAEAIKQWLSTVHMPVCTPDMQVALQKDAQRIYEQHLTRKVRELALQNADSDAKELIASVTKSNHVENHIKAMQLINLI